MLRVLVFLRVPADQRPKNVEFAKQHNACCFYFIFKSLEVGPTFRITVPKYPTKDPNYRIVANQRSRFTHYYFYIHDEVLGPFVMCMGSFFPFKATYYLNGHSFIEHQLSHAEI